jgi:hypothetical protein
MIALLREFIDGADRPELVLIHYTAAPADSPGAVLARSTLVVPPVPGSAKREVRLFLPAAGGRLLVRYAFSTVRSGTLWSSSSYEVVLPDPDEGTDVVRVEEPGEGNLRPAAGRGAFRLALPLRDGEPRTGTARFGFGAMRKKPSEALCRASLALDGERVPVIEVPEALSVLKGRPMPYFLYHVTDRGIGLVADKINCARITFEDREGDVDCAGILWGCGSWVAPNLSMMEVKGFAPGSDAAPGRLFSDDREAFLRERAEALSAHPLPRTHEAFVFGPAGSDVEYCFLAFRRRAEGGVAAGWRNREGGNWRIRL